jgi:glycerophosphoryl diester phosphodiesterase
VFFLLLACNSKPVTVKLNTHPEIIGHRGARGLFPENTVDGFVNTVKLGVRSLELDVVISKDEQVVVSHEPWMHYKFCSEPDGSRVRMKSQHNLYKLDYSEIRKFDCGKRGHKDFPTQQPAPAHKPLLSEVITALEQLTMNDSIPIEYIIEIKSHDKTDNLFHPQPARYAQLLYNELKKFGINEKIIVKSFDVRPLQEMHKLDPSLRIGLLVANLASVENNVKKLGFTPYTYNPGHRIVKAKTVEQAHRMGMKVMVWTVNTEEEIRAIAALGVDGIITDYPDVAFKVLKDKQ